MADRDLPDRPQLGQYKTQAEELVKAWKDGDPDAQLAIAREHHFETWEQFASSLINACHANGRPEGAAFLAARAVGLDLEAAAGVGRLDVVQTYFSGDGALINGATPRQMKDGFAWACEFGRAAVVDFILRQGMDVAEKLRHHGQTGLHWAAYEGHADTVRLLIERHSPINAIDDEFGGTPLGWALYGWGGGGPHPGHSRYYEVIEQLIAAGATVDAEWLNESERGFPLAKRIRDDERLRAALERTVRRRPIP